MKKFLLSAITMAMTCWSAWAQDSALDKLTIVDNVVQIASAEDFENFAQAVNEGNLALDAVLTADISEYTGTAVALEGQANAYSGTFDGQYHTININLTTTGANWGLFRALSGTIKNLHVSGLYTSAHNRSGVICGEIFGGTIESCWVSANIAATFGGDGAISGICGRASGTGSTIKNCVFSGNVDSGETGTYNCAGIVGWCPNPIDIINCIVTGEFNTNQLTGNARPIARYDGANNTNAQCVNCYYVNVNGTEANINTTQVTEDQVTSGELAYIMNGDQSVYTWFQNIGEDKAPVPFPTHKIVYATGEVRCDGAMLEDSPLTYSNTESYPAKPDHVFVDGICIVCGQADPSMAELVDGYYLITSPEQMLWFAAKVNSGDVNANAKVTADLDMTGGFTAIGNSSNRYAGIFDGQFHTITINMVTQDANYGMFRALSGTVKNLHVDGNFEAANNRVGVIAGEMFGGTVENCWVSADITATYSGDGAISGIAGRSSADGNVIRNCVFSGNITGTSAYNCSGIVGWSANLITIQNCLVTGEFNTDQSQGNARPIARHAEDNTNGATENCYFVNPNGTLTNVNTTQVTMEQVQSGEVGFLLNAANEENTWFQRIGEDEVPTPMPDRGVIYKVNKTYGNAYDDKSFQDFMTNVIDTETEYVQNVVAQTILVEEYEAAITNVLTGSNIDELVAAWQQIEPLYQQVVESEAAYAAFAAKMEEVLNDLKNNENLQNVKRDDLEYYLTEIDEPSAKYPNGTAPYIMEERLLDSDAIKAEAAKIDAMYNEAITYEPASGTDVTKLLTNPDFADGFNGWQGIVGTNYGTSETSPVRAAECYNATMDMYQTLTGLQNGVYELQVNGAFRPYPGADDLYNTNYAATLSLNGVENYFQALIEDMVAVGDDIDGYNCDHSSGWPDFEVKDIDDNVVGYVTHGIAGCCNAFQVNRYFNTILCEVTDGTLTVRLSQPGTGQQPEWVGFGNIKLIYHGTMDEASEALQRVLESQSARATTLVETYEFSTGADYATYPNFSQELKDKLQALIVKTTEKNLKPNTEYYAMVQEFSDLFKQVYECKKAYIGLMNQSEQIAATAESMSELLSEDEVKELYKVMEELIAMYETGSASIEEAQKNYLSSFPFLLQEVNGIYQIGSPADLIQFAGMVNGGMNAINAVMTADINMEGLEDKFTAMGNNVAEANYYAGTFDGQYHTLNINLTTTDANYGLFRALSGTVKNLHVSGTFTANHNRVGVIVGEIFGGTIENCWSSSEVAALYNGDGAISGICGRASGAGSTIKNCIFTGNMDKGETNTYNCAGIVGWCPNVIDIINCAVTGVFNTDQTQGNARPIARHDTSNSNANCVNCYFVNPNGTIENINTTQVTMEQVASGELCWKLNGDQKNIQWTQNIGESSTPVPFDNQSVVYIHGNLNCDGLSVIDGEATYENTPCTTIAPHTFVDGVCIVCGATDTGMAELKDGYYQIGTPEQLIWFASLVNSGETTANAKLTDNIFMEGYEDKFTPIGTSANHYAGIFDGQYYSIIVNFAATEPSYGFFRFLNGTVKNLHIGGTFEAKFNKTGVIAGEIFGGVIENCWVNTDIAAVFGGDAATAGIVGRGSADGSIIRNCHFSGNIDQGETTTWNCAGIMGWSGSKTTIENCLFTGKITVDESQGNGNVIGRNPGNITYINNYFVNTYGTVSEGCTQVTDEQIDNGEVCYLLNGDQSNIQWHQQIGLDIFPYPFPGSVVAKDENGNYYNAIQNIAEDKALNNSIFNLMGQKVEKAGKGIYIVNGKKVLFK